jgi:flavin reductase (DIM6/NTAB) family NADH-FMN oxidoreductase RutF
MTGYPLEEGRRALEFFPRGLFLLTARFESKRAGQLVVTAVACAHVPLLVCVSARKGHPIAPLIRDAHAFAVCIVGAEDRLLVRKFAVVEKGDPFDSLEVDRLVTGAPVPRRCIAAVDCTVVRHMDIEADHELYIGQVVGGRANGHTGKPAN